MTADPERDLAIELVPSSEDSAWDSDEYQADVTEIYQALICQDPRTSSYMLLMESAVSTSLAYGVFGMTLALVAPHVGKVLESWFAGRAGRKVRLKVEDIEAEAHSIAEVEKLLEKAQEIKRNSEAKKIYEP